MLADFLTMREHIDKPLEEMTFCYLGDARFNMANSYLIVGAKLGMDVRIAAPRSLWPAEDLVESAREFAGESGGQITITEDVEEAVSGCDVLLTDVWVSMGESDDVWAERIELLTPVPDQRADDGADRQPGRQVHALPAGVPQHRHAGRQGDLREVRHDRARGHRGGLRVARPRSCSTRPRTACTRSRRSWSPRSGADGARRRRPRRQRAAAARAGAVGREPARERARGLQGARAGRARARARDRARQRPAGRPARAPGLGLHRRRHVSARRPRRADRGDDRLHARAGARQRAPVRDVTSRRC